MDALVSPLVCSVEDPARGVVAVGRPEPAARLVQMPIDGVLGEAQLAGDLLGAHVAVDESKTLPLTLGEAVEAIDLVRKGGVTLVHRGGNFRRTFRFGKPPEH
jgi:hypothetical protein